MRRTVAFGLGILLLAAPTLAFADSLVPAQTVAQYMTVLANLEAQQTAATTGQSIACAVLTSVPTVSVNQPFALAWGSVGAMNPGDDSAKSMWSQNGASTVSISAPGTWAYSFTFYAKNGLTATCAAKITVTK